jgi:hypothetical protein
LASISLTVKGIRVSWPTSCVTSQVKTPLRARAHTHTHTKGITVSWPTSCVTSQVKTPLRARAHTHTQDTNTHTHTHTHTHTKDTKTLSLFVCLSVTGHNRALSHTQIHTHTQDTNTHTRARARIFSLSHTGHNSYITVSCVLADLVRHSKLGYGV